MGMYTFQLFNFLQKFSKWLQNKDTFFKLRI